MLDYRSVPFFRRIVLFFSEIGPVWIQEKMNPGSPFVDYFVEWFWNRNDGIVLVRVNFINNSRGIVFQWSA